VQFATSNAQTIAASPRIRLGTTSVADIEDAWDAYLASMPIGGVRVAGAPAGRLLREGLTKAILCGLPGVESVNLTTPSSDVVMGASEIIDPTYVITPEWVP
jgi:hypothetical protein